MRIAIHSGFSLPDRIPVNDYCTSPQYMVIQSMVSVGVVFRTSQSILWRQELWEALSMNPIPL